MFVVAGNFYDDLTVIDIMTTDVFPFCTKAKMKRKKMKKRMRMRKKMKMRMRKRRGNPKIFYAEYALYADDHLCNDLWLFINIVMTSESFLY